MTVEYNDFVEAVERVILYKCDKDIAFVRRMIAKLPPNLKSGIDPKILLLVKKFKTPLPPGIQAAMPIPETEFLNNTHDLAVAHIYGIEGVVAPNKDRARKLVRILKLSGDERYKTLENQMKKRK